MISITQLWSLNICYTILALWNLVRLTSWLSISINIWCALKKNYVFYRYWIQCYIMSIRSKSWSMLCKFPVSLLMFLLAYSISYWERCIKISQHNGFVYFFLRNKPWPRGSHSQIWGLTHNSTITVGMCLDVLAERNPGNTQCFGRTELLEVPWIQIWFFPTRTLSKPCVTNSDAYIWKGQGQYKMKRGL